MIYNLDLLMTNLSNLENDLKLNYYYSIDYYLDDCWFDDLNDRSNDYNLVNNLNFLVYVANI